MQAHGLATPMEGWNPHGMGQNYGKTTALKKENTMRRYSTFWLMYCAGLRSLSPEWNQVKRQKQPSVESTEVSTADMHAWLRLPEAERNTIVEGYAARRPRAARLASV